jgi:ABC-type branched-subunit amino acid transport system substrate-binding protein
VVSQVVPFPWDASIKAVADYQAALKALDPQAQPDFVSLEGYLAGRLAIAAMAKTGADLTREALLKTIKETGAFDIGGLKMAYGADQSLGLGEVFMTVIQPDGTFKSVDKLVKRSKN